MTNPVTEPAPAPSPLEVYRRAKDRLGDVLVRADQATPVLACPGWTVGDVGRHLVGVAEDVVAHDVGGFASASWTEDQIARHRSTPVADLLRFWDELEPRLPDALPAIDGVVPGVRSLTSAMAFDALAHEQDVRSALGLPAVPTDEAVVLVTDIAVASLRVRRSRASTGLHLHFEDGTIVDGGGVGPRWHLRAPRLEVWRALSGRRTRDEVLGMEWSARPLDDDLDIWLHPFFGWPVTPVGR